MFYLIYAWCHFAYIRTRGVVSGKVKPEIGRCRQSDEDSVVCAYGVGNPEPRFFEAARSREKRNTAGYLQMEAIDNIDSTLPTSQMAAQACHLGRHKRLSSSKVLLQVWLTWISWVLSWSVRAAALRLPVLRFVRLCWSHIHARGLAQPYGWDLFAAADEPLTLRP